MKAVDYPLLVLWSEDDQAYLARVLDLAGCIADGATVEEAVANARVVIQEWIETARELGREIPPPSDNETYIRSLAEATAAERRQFEEAVEATAKEMLDEVLPQVIAKVFERVEAEQPRQQRPSIFGLYGRKLALAHAD